jgi:hypothetical protein
MSLNNKALRIFTNLSASVRTNNAKEEKIKNFPHKTQLNKIIRL